MTQPVDALSGAAQLTFDQVGPQAVPMHFPGGPDITGWTWRASVWTGRAEDGGAQVCEVTVDTATVVTIPGVGTGDGTDGYAVLRISEDDALLLASGQLLEVVSLTPTLTPWLRAKARVREAVQEQAAP